MKILLIFLASLLLCGTTHAAIISINTISADATAAGIDDAFTTIVNDYNGNIQGAAAGSAINLLANTIGELDLGDDANPRIYVNEILDIGIDTITSSNSVVTSGLEPATDAGLTSNISAGVAYVNGFRCSKSATANTYTASRDTYVDLDQTCTFQFTEVSNGAAEPIVAANSARLSLVVTDGDNITTVTDQANRRVPGLIIPAHYRNWMHVSKDSTTVITIHAGSLEINNSIITKTATTSLAITTAGDWAGGSSLQAASTYGFVGVDSSGNAKLHTTAPSHNNFAVSVTVGKKRYATWSSTVHRIIGWFFMDGDQKLEGVSNIKEADVANAITSQDVNTVAFTSTTQSEIQRINYYTSGGPILLLSVMSGDTSVGGSSYIETQIQVGGTNILGAGSNTQAQGVNEGVNTPIMYLHQNQTQGELTYTVDARMNANTLNMRSRQFTVNEL